MPFRPDTLPSQITGARNEERRAVGAPVRPFRAGAAQSAKESAARWTQANIRNPETDSAPPWFTAARPFSETRFQNPKNFDDWKSRFLNETDMGASFAPPPPEPVMPPADPKSGVA